MKNKKSNKVIFSLLIVVSLICTGGLVYRFYAYRVPGVHQEQRHSVSSDQRLVKVVYDKDYVKRSGLSPQQFAKTTRTLMKVRVKKAYAAKDGSVVQVMTESQRKKIIRAFKEDIAKFGRSTKKENKKYRYVVGSDYRYLSVWLDERVSMDGYTQVVVFIPEGYSYLYYLEGHKGPWDMTIRIYNCHSGKLRLSFSYWKQPHVVWPLKVLK